MPSSRIGRQPMMHDPLNVDRSARFLTFEHLRDIQIDSDARSTCARHQRSREVSCAAHYRPDVRFSHNQAHQVCISATSKSLLLLLWRAFLPRHALGQSKLHEP
jgi:hypothetical protein